MSIDIDAHNLDVGNDDGEDLTRYIVDYEFSWQDGCMWVSRHVPDAGFHSQHCLDSRGMKAGAATTQQPECCKGYVRDAWCVLELLVFHAIFGAFAAAAARLDRCGGCGHGPELA